MNSKTPSDISKAAASFLGLLDSWKEDLEGQRDDLQGKQDERETDARQDKIDELEADIFDLEDLVDKIGEL